MECELYILKLFRIFTTYTHTPTRKYKKMHSIGKLFVVALLYHLLHFLVVMSTMLLFFFCFFFVTALKSENKYPNFAFF